MPKWKLSSFLFTRITVRVLLIMERKATHWDITHSKAERGKGGQDINIAKWRLNFVDQTSLLG
jgi:hypothetical protein